MMTVCPNNCPFIHEAPNNGVASPNWQTRLWATPAQGCCRAATSRQKTDREQRDLTSNTRILSCLSTASLFSMWESLMDNFYFSCFLYSAVNNTLHFIPYGVLSITRLPLSAFLASTGIQDPVYGFSNQGILFSLKKNSKGLRKKRFLEF